MAPREMFTTIAKLSEAHKDDCLSFTELSVPLFPRPSDQTLSNVVAVFACLRGDSVSIASFIPIRKRLYSSVIVRWEQANESADNLCWQFRRLTEQLKDAKDGENVGRVEGKRGIAFSSGQ